MENKRRICRLPMDRSRLAREEEQHKLDRTMSPPRRTSLSLIGLAFLVAMAASLLIRFSSVRKPIQPRMWTAEELAPHNGTDEKIIILLGILGSVFDVTKGKSHYGPGSGYHHFAGRDASRAFVSRNFTGDGLTDSLHDLSGAEMSSVVDWRKFYFERYMGSGRCRAKSDSLFRSGCSSPDLWASLLVGTMIRQETQQNILKGLRQRPNELLSYRKSKKLKRLKFQVAIQNGASKMEERYGVMLDIQG